MNVWVWSAGAGVAIGATIFFLVLVPILVWQFRSYGRLSPARLLGAAAVSVYASALVAYTQLPLPPTRSLSWCETYGVEGVQLTPFESFNTMIMRASEIGWGSMLASTLGLQVIFNVILFIPLGMIVKGFLQRSFGTAVLVGALVSLVIETTQATGLWGLYPCAYRLGDVDDLITNTLGAAIGAALARLVLFWMPRSSSLAVTRLQPRPVTAARRFFSMILTYGAIWSVSTLVSFVILIAWRLISGKVNTEFFDWVQWGVHLCAVFVLIYVPALQGRGSFGQHVVWLAPRWRSRKGLTPGNIGQRVARASVLGVPLALVGIPGWEFGTMLFWTLASLSALMIPFTYTRRSLSGWLTRAELIDSRVGGRS